MMMIMMIAVEPSQWGKLTISASPDNHNIHDNDDVIIIIINITEEPGQWGKLTISAGPDNHNIHDDDDDDINHHQHHRRTRSVG